MVILAMLTSANTNLAVTGDRNGGMQRMTAAGQQSQLLGGLRPARWLAEQPFSSNASVWSAPINIGGRDFLPTRTAGLSRLPEVRRSPPGDARPEFFLHRAFVDYRQETGFQTKSPALPSNICRAPALRGQYHGERFQARWSSRTVRYFFFRKPLALLGGL